MVERVVAAGQVRVRLVFDAGRRHAAVRRPRRCRTDRRRSGGDGVAERSAGGRVGYVDRALQDVGLDLVPERAACAAAYAGEFADVEAGARPRSRCCDAARRPRLPGSRAPGRLWWWRGRDRRRRRAPACPKWASVRRTCRAGRRAGWPRRAGGRKLAQQFERVDAARSARRRSGSPNWSRNQRSEPPDATSAPTTRWRSGMACPSGNSASSR